MDATMNTDNTAPASLRVYGWQQSKAANDLQSLVGFLERKASNRQQSFKILSTKVLRDFVVIEVTEPARFLHLNGFTFAGATLRIEEDRRRMNQNQTYTNGGSLSDRITSTTGESPMPDRTNQPRNNQSAFRRRGDRPPPSSDRLQPNGSFSSQQRTTSLHHRRLPGTFQDVNGTGENFLKAFFPLYDTNRELVVQQFYDDDSTFSLSATTDEPHTQQRQSQDWSQYIKHSRNFTRLKRPQARHARIHYGQRDIYKVWADLPKSIHPTFEGEQLKEWCLESRKIDRLPGQAGEPAGVEGLEIIVHGALEDLGKDGKATMRSFTRTFMLGPGSGIGGLRVISDSLSMRPYTGKFETQPRPITPNGQAAPPAPKIEHPEVPAGSTVGIPADGKSAEQLLKEQMCLELSFRTKLKLAVAEQCLSANNWNLEAAVVNLEQLVQQGAIGQDAFLNV